MIVNYKKTYINIIIKENYPVEIITFILILVSVLIGIILVISMYRKSVASYKIIFVSFVTLGLLFVGLEEISWGQWFFSFKSPDYFKDTNLQRETNIHNLKDLHVIFEYIRVLIGLGGLVSIFLNNKKTFKYISSPFVLVVSFTFITVFSGIDVYNFYHPNQRLLYQLGGFWWFMKFNMEIIELLISISALVFLWSNYRRLNYQMN